MPPKGSRSSPKSGPSKTPAPTYITSNNPVPWYDLSLRTVVLVLLPLLSVAGVFGTWILSGSNGTVPTLNALMVQKAPLLPGTTDLLLKSYTGVSTIDRQLTVLVSFFAPVLDSHNSALTLFSIYGLGQFGGGWTLMMMESMRRGNKGKLISFVGTVGFIFQNITFTVTAPLWLFLHILTSPTAGPFPGTHANSVLLVSSPDLLILPFSVTLGYIVPSILMALPSQSVVSPLQHQQLIALWQPFPIWCVLIHWSIRYIYNLISSTTPKENSNKRMPTSPGASYLSQAKRVYGFILGLCLITHIPALVLSLFPPGTFPDSSPELQSLAENSFAGVFIPYFPSLSYQVPNFAAGIHAFLQWDMHIGAIAFLLWAVLLHRNATAGQTGERPSRESSQNKTSWTKLLGKIVLWTLVSGPMGTLTWLLWERDTIVALKIKQGE